MRDRTKRVRNLAIVLFGIESHLEKSLWENLLRGKSSFQGMSLIDCGTETVLRKSEWNIGLHD
jgi:hypothetical protein